MEQDTFMKYAVELASRGLGWTKSNPLVGAVVVKNRKIIGEGWHEYFGEAHAEVNAVSDAEVNGYSVSGAEIFVTLEPCAHSGKTSPCTELILQKNIKKVSVLFRDPNPLVAGKSVEFLKENGVEIDENFPELREEFFDLNEDFFYFITEKKPFIALKMAMDKNGYIGSGTSERTVISGPEAQEYTHFLRQKYEAILVGANTVILDNPHLGVRLGNFYQGKRDPLRIIFDPHLKTERSSQVYRDENFLVVATSENESKATKIFGERVFGIPFLPNGEFNLNVFANKMGKRSISSILVEGGKKTAESFLEQKCVQKGYFFVSSEENVLGSEGIRGIDFKNIPQFKFQKIKNMEKETLWIAIKTL